MNDLRMNNRITRFATTLALLFALAHASQAQDREQTKANEYALQQEQIRKSLILREYDSAVYLMDNQQYEAADDKFKYVLANIKSVPSDLTFHFGKNSFHLAKYKQSIDWLTKYIQLKGTSGQYYAEAVEWKKKAEAEFLKEKTKETEKVQQVFSTDYDIDCGPSGKVTCPVCKGDHVIIRKGAFGNEYKTCGYCDDHGLLNCDEYNKLLRGQLKPKS
jgi:hypothetical protein